MKYIYTLFFCCLYFGANAQIIAPDTVCVGTTVNFTTSHTATTYSWDFSPMNIIQPISTISTFFTSGLTNPAWTCFNKDGANYYCFVTDYSTEHLKRLSYGTNINSAPVVTDFGTLGMAGTRLECVDIVKDTATGMWYGLMVDNTSMGVLSFGSSLSNTPTCVVTAYPTHMSWTHQVTIKRWHGNWTAFIANRNTTITRFDFGSSLTNVPVITDIPNVGSVANPCNFSLYEQGGNWYMLVTSLIVPNITRYDFGTNLLNNAPAGTLLPSPGGMLFLPRYINLINDCNNNLIGFIGNETGDIIRLDFAGSITNLPAFTVVGSAGATTINGATPCAYSDSFCFLTVNYSGAILRYFPLYFTPQAFINYYNPAQPYTYTTTGTFGVSLFCDMGYTSGPFVYCKNIVVVAGTGTATRKDTTICAGTPFTLYADTTGKYLWSTGDTTFSILRSTAGLYWVTTTTGACRYKSDTTNVTYASVISVNLGPDTAFCIGGSITLDPAVPAGTTLNWSTGATSPSITVNAAGKYWVSVNNGGCTGSDTVNISVNPMPVVDLGPDQSVCTGDPVTLQPTGTYVSPTYLWSTGSTAASISPTTSGNYWLKVTVGGCTGADTVEVDFKPIPQVKLGNDTSICPGNVLTLGAPEPPGTKYSWSTGSTDSSISVSEAGTYTLNVDLNGCKASAAIIINMGGLDSVNLGPDTSLCIGDQVELKANNKNAIWSTGHKGSSIIVQYPGVYWVSVVEPCGIITDTVKVDFHMCDLAFPSAFTPNGDGKNDIIGVLGTLKYYRDFSLSIFNRWGQRVFYTEDIYAGWDGIFNGARQDLGTYFYMIFYSLEGKKGMMKGDFQLIR